MVTFAWPMPFSSSKRLLGLALTAEGWCLSLVARDNGRCRVMRRFTLPGGEGALEQDPRTFGEQCGAWLDQAGVRDRACAASLPAEWALPFRVDWPDMAEEDLAGYLGLEAERLWSWSAGEVRLAAVPNGNAEGPRVALAAALPESRYRAVDGVITAFGGRLVSLGLDLDPGWIRRGGPDGMECIPGPLGVLTGLRLDGALSDWMFHPGTMAARENQSTADTLSPWRIFLNRQPGPVRSRIQSLRWLGETSPPATWHTLLPERLGLALRCEPGESPETLPGDEDAPTRAAARVLLGLPPLFEYVAARKKRWPILPERFRRRDMRRAVALGLTAVLGAAAWWGGRGLQERRLSARVAELAPLQEEIHVLQERLRRYRTWNESAAGQPALWERLTEAFPDEGSIWVRRIEMRDRDRITCVGLARSPDRVMDLLDALRSRPGFRDIQVLHVRGADPVQYAFEFTWAEKPVREPSHE